MHFPWLHPACFFAVLATCGLAYQFLVIAGIVKFCRLQRLQPGQDGPETPPISILKPLRGADPRMYEAFRSHCLQDYPVFEIIFGVADASDPAVAEVERLRQEFPSQSIHLMVCPELLGTNRKVSTLVQLLPLARYDLLLINDSDIRVPPDYLRQIAAGFASRGAAIRTGMVTALYRAAANPSKPTTGLSGTSAAGSTLASRLEALTVATDFAGGVLSAYALEGRLTFGLGSTLAVRREALEAIGGLRALLDYLADDYELGNRIARAGFEVVLAPLVVETQLPNATFREMFQHQLRWARTIRDRRLGGYIGLGVTYVVPWALLACLFSGLAGWSLGLLAVTGLLRFAVAAVLCTSVLRDEAADLDLWLLPLRDVVALLVWIASFAGNTVEWRGERFRLHAGKLQKL
ncbi:MAG: bacteriohopanetetrol glucosamine biosynthesis glycosyltransferase HpnI [Candidatus Korobacteraceae bacterium]